ncbi:MAG: protease, partial [Tannerella sp.]|nr:protease [Tannerella sp.]
MKFGFRRSLFTCLVGILLFLSPHIFAQISEGGLPPSFSYQQMLRKATAETKVPIDFYIEDLRETDDWQARDGAPKPVARLIPVDYTMDNSGYRTTLPGGEKIWRLHLKADDAVAIMLYYNDFYIPEGGKLFIYSANKSQILGAYTHRTHPSGGLFATEFIGGDELILEYVESNTSKEKPRININEIGYGYNTAALRTFCGITTRASGSCMVNINCEEGIAWQNEKKSVCYTVQVVGNENYICTASLMNNTAEDFKPLVLTALHCAYNNRYNVSSSDSDFEQWLFYFHREREDCSNSSLPIIAKTMTGCKKLAQTGLDGGSDGLLLMLNDMIPEDYDVFYNGWDRRGVAALSGVCIHHPSGDYKKISTYNTPTTNYTFEVTQFTCDKNAHWNLIFAQTANGFSVTEEGSSGSPLYNENKLVIGTLTGGSSSCTIRRGFNIYGKMSYHWDKYKTDSSTRMDVWLDPLNLGVETLCGRFRKELKPSPTNLKVVNLGRSVSLTWKAPSDEKETPVGYNIYRNNTKIGETTSLYFVDYEPVTGSLAYSVSAVYADKEESAFTTATMFYVQYKAPSDLNAKRLSNDNNQIELSWNAPLYEQTIYWGTMETMYTVGFKHNDPFYFGQKWTPDEISPLNKKTIKAVQFIPMRTHTYEVYISQGNRTYKKNIDTSSLDYLSINTIPLDEPFVIDGSKSLIVSIYVSQVGDYFYPAISDNGPVVGGKGNIYSFDGNNWAAYNEYSPEGKQYYNFAVSAIVSSESGTIPADNRSSVLLNHNSEITESRNVQPRVAAIPMIENTVSLRSSQPAVFPEVTRYNIYRSGSFYEVINASETTYTYAENSFSHYYEVSAIYDDIIESEKSDKAYITSVDTENINASVNISPTRFSNHVSLKGYESVKRVDVVSVSGKICLVV